MIRILILTPELRRELKKPLGVLIKGSYQQTAAKISELIKDKKPAKMIAVGDRVSRNLLKNGIFLDVAIVDYKIMRKPVSPWTYEVANIFRAKNPAGTLTEETWKAVEMALNSSGKSIVIIEGEEDLVTLIAVLCAPDGSLVVYGQPREGVVILNVNEETKRKVCEIIKRMKRKN